MKQLMIGLCLILSATQAHAANSSSMEPWLTSFTRQFAPYASIVRQNLRMHENRLELALDEVSQGKTLSESPLLQTILKNTRQSIQAQSFGVGATFATPVRWAVDQIAADLTQAQRLPIAKQRLKTLLDSVRTLRQQFDSI